MRGILWEPTEQHLAMWSRGWSCTRIAEKAGVCKETVCRTFKRLGIDIKNRPQPNLEEAIKESWRLKRLGWVMRDIVDEVGYSRRHIQRWLNPKNTAP